MYQQRIVRIVIMAALFFSIFLVAYSLAFPKLRGNKNVLPKTTTGEGTVSEEGVSQPSGMNQSRENQTACPADAQVCPDGSYVGRSSPNCDFDPCPGINEGDD